MANKKMVVIVVLAFILFCGFFDIVLNNIEVFENFARNAEARPDVFDFPLEKIPAATYHDKITTDLSEEDKLIIINNYGNIEVRGISENQLKVEVDIEIFSDQDKKAEEFLKNVKPTIQNEDGKVNVILGKKKNLPKWIKGIRATLIVYAPERLNLEIESVGYLIVNDFLGSVKAKNRYGKTTILRIQNDVELTQRAGTVNIGGIHGNINLKSTFGYVNAGDIYGNLTLNYQGGDVTITNLQGILECEGFAGSFSGIELKGKVNATFDQCRVYFGNLEESIKLNSHSGSITLNDLKKDVDVLSDNTNINLIMKNLNHQISAKAKYGRIFTSGEPFEVIKDGSIYQLSGTRGQGKYQMKLETKKANIYFSPEKDEISRSLRLEKLREANN